MWSKLPLDIIRLIIEKIDDIDVRLAFKIPPKKLGTYRLPLRPEIVYLNSTKTMFDFTGMSEPHPYWIIRRQLPFSQYRSSGIHVFNMEWDEYDMTMFTETGTQGPTKCKNHLATYKRVKFI